MGYGERLRETGQSAPAKSRLRGDLAVAFTCLKGRQGNGDALCSGDG